MAVPKHKTSKSKRDKRRTHKKLSAPNLSTCPDCGEAFLLSKAILRSKKEWEKLLASLL